MLGLLTCIMIERTVSTEKLQSSDVGIVVGIIVGLFCALAIITVLVIVYFILGRRYSFILYHFSCNWQEVGNVYIEAGSATQEVTCSNKSRDLLLEVLLC